MKEAFKVAFWNWIVLKGFFYALILIYSTLVYKVYSKLFKKAA